jgi:hypothetical protein
MVWLDPHNHIMAMNGVAMDVLNVQPGELIGREILSIHPPQSREKVKWLLEQSENPSQSAISGCCLAAIWVCSWPAAAVCSVKTIDHRYPLFSLCAISGC